MNSKAYFTKKVVFSRLYSFLFVLFLRKFAYKLLDNNWIFFFFRKMKMNPILCTIWGVSTNEPCPWWDSEGTYAWPNNSFFYIFIAPIFRTMKGLWMLCYWRKCFSKTASYVCLNNMFQMNHKEFPFSWICLFHEFE